MSEHEAGQTGGESGSLSVGGDISASSETSHELSAEASSPEIAPRIDQPEAAAAKEEVSKPEVSKPEPRIPGKVVVMPPGDRGFGEHGAASEPEDTIFGKRRLGALAAVVALAAVAGALSGAMATSAFIRGGQAVAGNDGQPAVEASLSRIDADIQALKAGLDRASKLGMSQFGKTSDRLDRLERAQAEPAAKLAKLSDAIDKLRAAPAAVPAATVAAAPSVANEITGSIPAAAPSAFQQTAATPPKSDVGRLPTLGGWVLRDVAQGGALIDGRRGIYEVFAGDVVPGLGRIDAIRRQDGRWVVVTSRGLIVAR